MAAKIGILAESTVVTANTTTTVYTVPADKSARVRILWAGEGGTSPRCVVRIGSPGTECTWHIGTVSLDDMWTGILEKSTPIPPYSKVAADLGVNTKEAGFGTSLTTETGTTNWMLAPMPSDYFLSTGDTVQFQNGAVLSDQLIQVHGVEDDA